MDPSWCVHNNSSCPFFASRESPSEEQHVPPVSMGLQQTYWGLQIDPADVSSSLVDELNPYTLKKKKKKKKKKAKDKDNSICREDVFSDDLVQNNHLPSCSSGEDYIYSELLTRVFDKLHEDNVEVPDERQRAVMMPPPVLAEAMQSTVCVNFFDLCKTMNRKADHVMSFLLSAIGTRGSLDKQQRLLMKARVPFKDFETVFRRYISEYVICSCCKSPDTVLAEKNLGFVLRCEMCGSVVAVNNRSCSE